MQEGEKDLRAIAGQGHAIRRLEVGVLVGLKSNKRDKQRASWDTGGKGRWKEDEEGGGGRRNAQWKRAVWWVAAVYLARCPRPSFVAVNADQQAVL